MSGAKAPGYDRILLIGMLYKITHLLRQSQERGKQ